jgi:hypothetical protein
MKKTIQKPFEAPESISRLVSGEEVVKKNRVMPHVEGNFRTTINLDLRNEDLNFLENILEKAIDVLKEKFSNFKNNLVFEPIPVDSLHISLCKTVYLKPHLIDSFLSQIRLQVSKQNLETIVATFDKKESSFSLFLSEDKTKFIIGKCLKVDHELFELTDEFSKIFQTKFGLPGFFEKPVFHISFALCYLKDDTRRNEIFEFIGENCSDKQFFFDFFKNSETTLETSGEDLFAGKRFVFDCLTVNIGKDAFDIDLSV